MLSPTTILSISMLVFCSRPPESSDFGGRNTKIVYIIVITVIVHAVISTDAEQNK